LAAEISVNDGLDDVIRWTIIWKFRFLQWNVDAAVISGTAEPQRFTVDVTTTSPSIRFFSLIMRPNYDMPPVMDADEQLNIS
jgi:hypothetical protein